MTTNWLLLSVLPVLLFLAPLHWLQHEREADREIRRLQMAHERIGELEYKLSGLPKRVEALEACATFHPSPGDWCKVCK